MNEAVVRLVALRAGLDAIAGAMDASIDAGCCSTGSPLPRLRGRWYSISRRTVYRWPRCKNSSSTNGAVSGAAKSLCRPPASRYSPLACPYSA